MSAKKSKRLKIDDRVMILQRLEIGELSTNLASEYGVTMSAISHMKKNKDLILSQKQLLDDIQGNSERKRFTGIENTPLDRCLYEWYIEKQSMGEVPSGANLQEQALIINKLLNGPDTFKASHGFLVKFKKRWDLGNPTDESEKSTIDESSSDKFSQELNRYLETQDYGFDQIYSVDETELSWKSLPKKMSIIKTEPDDSSYNDEAQSIVDRRVTIIACTNASGTHKLPLLIMGNANESRSLRNIRYLPVVYKDKKFFCDDNPMLDWYREIFIPEISKKHRHGGEKCLLLMNSTSDNSSVEDFHSISDICTVMHLPSNIDSSMQPMRQGIVDKLKKVYKRNLIRFLLTEDSIEDVEKSLGSLTMLQCCNSLASSWKEITENDVKNGWKNILVFDVNFTIDETNLEPKDFARCIRKIPGYGTTTIAETTDWLNQDRHERQSTNSSNEFMSVNCDDVSAMKVESENHERTTTPKDALCGVDSIIAWYQTKWECSQHNLDFLEKLRTLAIADIVSNKI